MKKLVIAVAVVLATLCLTFLLYRSYFCPQALSGLVQTSEWTQITLAQQWAGTDASKEIAVDKTALSQALNSATVRNAAKFDALPEPCLEFFISTNNQDTINLVIGENGQIACGLVSDLAGSRKFWRVVDGSPYKDILKLLQQ